MAPASAEIWRASTLPRSETDLMWHLCQRKSLALTHATPFSTASLDGVVIGLDIMNTVGARPFGITWSRFGGTPRVTWMYTAWSPGWCARRAFTASIQASAE